MFEVFVSSPWATQPTLLQNCSLFEPFVTEHMQQNTSPSLSSHLPSFETSLDCQVGFVFDDNTVLNIHCTHAVEKSVVSHLFFFFSFCKHELSSQVIGY